MKTDALSVEAEGRGGVGVGGWGVRRTPAAAAAQPALLSQGSPDDNKMRFVYLINQSSMAFPFNPFAHMHMFKKLGSADTGSGAFFFRGLCSEKSKS